MKEKLDEIVTKEMIDNVLNEHIADLGNQVLYDMCQNYFDHTKNDAIFAKTWIIGRSYAVALERNNSKQKSEVSLPNDDFYGEVIIPTFLKQSKKIDEKLISLRNKKLNDGVLLEIFGTYKLLVEITNKLNRGTKRSFCSKYLHFHLPDLFFIYDSRAVKAITKCEIKISKEDLDLIHQFPEIQEYTNFFFKCLKLQHWVEEKWGESFTPREIDKLLLMIDARYST